VRGKSVLRLMIITNWFLDHYGRNSEIPSQPYAIIISYRLITLQGWLDCAFLGHRLITAARLDCAPDAFRCIVARTSNEYRLSSHRYYKTGYNRHKLRLASVYLRQCAKSMIVRSLMHYKIVIIIDELNGYLRSYILWLSGKVFIWCLIEFNIQLSILLASIRGISYGKC